VLSSLTTPGFECVTTCTRQKHDGCEYAPGFSPAGRHHSVSINRSRLPKLFLAKLGKDAHINECRYEYAELA
jgi:hypothetical protein